MNRNYRRDHQECFFLLRKKIKNLRIYFVYLVQKMIERIKWNERSNSFNFDLDGIEGGSGREWVGRGKWVRGASRRTRGEFRKPCRACSRVGHPKAVVCFLRMLFPPTKFSFKKSAYFCGSWIVTSSCPVSGKKHCRLVEVSHERKNVTSSPHMDNSEERGVRWEILEQQSVGDRLEFCRLCLHFSIACDCCPGVCNNHQILEEKQSFYSFLYSELCSKEF